MDDLKNKVEEIVNKVKNDGDFAKKFQENPVQAVESVIGVDLPDDQINGVINTVKAKVNVDNFGDKLKGIFGK
ncbi:MAG: hypothetical protein IKG14_06470 [Clostridia bacterium]|nr:hypothetical protein [Clostridia bacterium]